MEKVISPHPGSGEPEKAQIAVEGADHLYREIRVPNRLIDENGHKVKLKEGAEVEIKIEADKGQHAVGPRPRTTTRNQRRLGLNCELLLDVNPID